MDIEKIVDNGKILAMIIKNEHWKEGLNFVSSEEDFMQVGFWDYKKGHTLAAHAHLECERKIFKTQEVIFIKSGSVKINVFREDGSFLKTEVLKSGDTAVLLNGGHGYEILEDGTKVLEVKNGPYVGPEKDRKRI